MTALSDIAAFTSVAEAETWRKQQEDATMTAAVYAALIAKIDELRKREGGR